MSFRSKNLIAALEEAELVDGIQPGGAGEVVPATAPEVEAGSAELVAQVEEVEELQVAAEEAEADAEALGDVQELMQEAVDSGEGMSEQTAEMAEVAVESICARLGFDRSQRTLPAMESFGQTGTRLSSTKIALENLTDRAKRIWQGIWNWLKQIWEKIKGFVAGLLKNRGMLQKHLEALLKRADEAKTKALKPKEDKLKGGVAKAVSVDGKADKASALAVVASSKKLLDAAKSISPDLTSVNASTLTNAGGLADFVKKLSSTAQQALGSLGSGTAEKAEEGYSYHGSLVGGKVIGVKAGEKDGAAELKLVVANGKTADEAAALSAADASEVIKAALELVKELAKFDKIEKDLQTASKHAMDAVAKHMQAVGKAEEGDDAGKDVAKNVSNMREITGVIAKLSLQFPTLVFQAAKAAGDYASASLNNLKEEEKKAA
jgi:hypothetical protein